MAEVRDDGDGSPDRHEQCEHPLHDADRGLAVHAELVGILDGGQEVEVDGGEAAVEQLDQRRRDRGGTTALAHPVGGDREHEQGQHRERESAGPREPDGRDLVHAAEREPRGPAQVHAALEGQRAPEQQAERVQQPVPARDEDGQERADRRHQHDRREQPSRLVVRAADEPAPRTTAAESDPEAQAGETPDQPVEVPWASRVEHQ